MRGIHRAVPSSRGTGKCHNSNSPQVNYRAGKEAAHAAEFGIIAMEKKGNFDSGANSRACPKLFAVHAYHPRNPHQPDSSFYYYRVAGMEAVEILAGYWDALDLVAVAPGINYKAIAR
jgi:hypothetical protein